MFSGNIMVISRVNATETAHPIGVQTHTRKTGKIDAVAGHPDIQKLGPEHPGTSGLTRNKTVLPNNEIGTLPAADGLIKSHDDPAAVTQGKSIKSSSRLAEDILRKTEIDAGRPPPVRDPGGPALDPGIHGRITARIQAVAAVNAVVFTVRSVMIPVSSISTRGRDHKQRNNE